MTVESDNVISDYTSYRLYQTCILIYLTVLYTRYSWYNVTLRTRYNVISSR